MSGTPDIFCRHNFHPGLVIFPSGLGADRSTVRVGAGAWARIAQQMVISGDF